MSPELASKLTADFPLLYAGEGVFSFECKDGWYDIIRELSEKLEHLNRTTGLSCVASQVKEKFGTLRFYCTDEDAPPALVLIQSAMNKSAVTCERCGEPGNLREGGWLKTLCDKCFCEWLSEASRR